GCLGVRHTLERDEACGDASDKGDPRAVLVLLRGEVRLPAVQPVVFLVQGVEVVRGHECAVGAALRTDVDRGDAGGVRLGGRTDREAFGRAQGTTSAEAAMRMSSSRGSVLLTSKAHTPSC